MHNSVMKFVQDALGRQEVQGKTVLEVGSRNVNGGVREIVTALLPAQYTGVDLVPGPGVDVILPADQVGNMFSGAMDVVIATELLEHIEFWRPAVMSMKTALKPGGILIVTTRAPGFPYHPHPGDCWRFTVYDFYKIFSDFEIIDLYPDPQQDHPGVFLKARKPTEWWAADLSSIHPASVG